MRLIQYKADTYSQFGEDGMIAKIFSLIGVVSRVCVEFGAADGDSCSNTAKLWRAGWKALLVEGDEECFHKLQKTIAGHDHVHAINLYLTSVGESSIDAVMRRQLINEVDFMSIDVDGLDYEIWMQMAMKPRVICIEYNQSIPPHIALRQGTYEDCLGSSAKALVQLGEHKGYELVGMNKANLFFVLRSEISKFDGFDRLLTDLFPYEGLSYAGTDYRGRPFIMGNPPWGLVDEPYIGTTMGDPIQMYGTVAGLVKSLEQDVGYPAVYIGQDWDVNPSVPTDIGAESYRKLFGSEYPVVIVDVSNQQSLEECRWIEAIALEYDYRMRIVRRDLIVFVRTPRVVE